MQSTRTQLVVLFLAAAFIGDIDLQCRYLLSYNTHDATFSGVSADGRNQFARRRPFEWLGAWASPLPDVEETSIIPRWRESDDMSHFLTRNTSQGDVGEREYIRDGGSSTSMASARIDETDLETFGLPRHGEVPMGWVDPRLRGGRMLDFTLPGRGEPLNVIISGLSDPYILSPRGLLHYAQTLGFSTECLGLHIGMLHVANLGDSMAHDPYNDGSSSRRFDSDDPESDPYPRDGGNKTEKLLVRQNFDWPLYGWPDYGTCWESLVGGNHFRAWKQDGAGARTGAWFLAVSQELWVGAHHDIAPNGYNGGRDHLVSRALRPTRWSPTLDGLWWKTEVTYNTSLLEPGHNGINHGIAQDGTVAILTVRRRDGPPSLKELKSAWQGGLNSSVGWNAAERRRAQWELQSPFQGGNLPMQSESAKSISQGWWHWTVRLFYQTWTLR